MADYFVNPEKDGNGYHEVHREGCIWFTHIGRPQYLGDFLTCMPAVIAAQQRGYHAQGCYHCSKDCNVKK